MFVNNRLERSITMSKVIRYTIKESIDLNGDSVKYTLVNKDNQNIHYGKICPTTVKAAKFLKEINGSGKDFDNEHLFIDSDSKLTFETDNILNGLYVCNNSNVIVKDKAHLHNVFLEEQHGLILGAYDCYLKNVKLRSTHIDPIDNSDQLIIKDSSILGSFRLRGKIDIRNSQLINYSKVMKVQNSTIHNVRIIPVDPRILLNGNDLIDAKKFESNIFDSILKGFIIRNPIQVKNTIICLTSSKNNDDFDTALVEPFDKDTSKINILNINDIDLELNINADDSHILEKIREQQNKWKNKNLCIEPAIITSRSNSNYIPFNRRTIILDIRTRN